MTEKVFSFRWDVDHRACMTDGVPRIRALCRELGVANTFFVNMGCSTNLREWLGKGLRGSQAKLQDMQAVNLIEKIGWPRFALETLLARPVGLSFLPELEALAGDGHELGLHGGMDHVVWSRRFARLPAEVIEADVAESERSFAERLGKPAGFASPGFQSDERVLEMLDRRGYAHNGDAIGGEPARARSGKRTLGHWTIPVTLCGPRTIPFLEYHGARGTSEAEVFRELDLHLAARELVVLYGHPCYEGVREGLLRRVFASVRAAGFRFVTHREIAERLERDERRASAAS